MYIGKTPTVGNFQVCDAISVVNGQAAYTLQVGGVNVAPESANHMLVSLNGILQKPGSSFTISSSTMTFASNLATGDVIDFVQILGNVLDIGQPSDDTVTAAKINNDVISGQTELAATPADTDELLISDAGTIKRIDFSHLKTGITMADSWRLTADITATEADITANLERDDTSGAGYIGSAMTVSSGIFTFPSTGVYQIVMYANWKVTNENIATLQMFTTVNNSSYTQRADIYASTGQSDHYKNSSASVFFDVTDTSQCKVKFATYGLNSNCTLRGSTDKNETHFTFVRLGDT